ncbi:MULTISPECIES: hypothetical protein [unclassified Moraxella]|uniref:hypothetical protein n=1 Tax=unclassified Moraxella TaxID=2685852 RepID=UPI003AF676FC
MFWLYFVGLIGFALTLLLLLPLIIDGYMKFFGEKVLATVESVEITAHPNPKLPNYILYMGKLSYHYVYKGKKYHSERINAFGELLRENKGDVERELAIKDNKITVYVCKFHPNFVVSHPLTMNKKFYIPMTMLVLLFFPFISYLVIKKLTVFDVFFKIFG